MDGFREPELPSLEDGARHSTGLIHSLLSSLNFDCKAPDARFQGAPKLVVTACHRPASASLEGEELDSLSGDFELVEEEVSTPLVWIIFAQHQ